MPEHVALLMPLNLAAQRGAPAPAKSPTAPALLGTAVTQGEARATTFDTSDEEEAQA